MKGDLRKLSEFKIRENDNIHQILPYKGDIGIFDSQHLESEGREWLMKTNSDPSQREVYSMIEGLGASQTA
jgi:hypothetical protein